MTETDKVSTAPEDVERLAKGLDWKVDKDACANGNSHADYIEWQAAATLLALSAEVERLRGALKPFADLHDEIEIVAKKMGADPLQFATSVGHENLCKARAALGE